jgi:hypothetical protein
MSGPRPEGIEEEWDVWSYDYPGGRSVTYAVDLETSRITDAMCVDGERRDIRRVWDTDDVWFRGGMYYVFECDVDGRPERGILTGPDWDDDGNADPSGQRFVPLVLAALMDDE